MKKPFSALLTATVLMVSMPGVAQISDYPLSPVQYPSQMLFNQAAQIGVAYGVEYRDGDEPDGGDLPIQSLPGDNDIELLAYEPDPARSRANLQAFVATNSASNPALGKELAAIFSAQPTLLSDIGGAMEGYGLDPYNLADTYALWWISAWLAANQRTDTPSTGAIMAVRDQARAAFLSTDDTSRMSDADKQQFAEALMIQSVLIDASVEQAAGRAETLARIAQAAQQGAKDNGLDLSLMTLTEAGFVPREGADASDAASENGAAAPSADLPILLAVASLAGFGIGSAYWIGKSQRG